MEIYKIEDIRKIYEKAFQEMIDYFELFFANIKYDKKLDRKIKKTTISCHADLKRVVNVRGLYLIATNYKYLEDNDCTLEIEAGCKVIYRGHCSEIRERIESHLFNSKHPSKTGGRKFDVCMGLDGNIGINIDSDPYKKYKWIVVTHSMPDSLEPIREAAEMAFDKVFNMPRASSK